MHAGYEDFEKFMTFMEGLIGEAFLSYLHNAATMANVITEMIALAGASPDWGEGHTMPEDVFAR
jgi:hypothetical protein